MPASQPAASERRTDKMTTPEPPKLKTTLKTPPKQATNPLQFVKVGPCALYRSAQEQLQKVEEVKKIKQEVREEPEDWQSNLDNWKSSRRKRQEHIIERVVEVKKLELEEHDRQRRRSKTFSEMMEERGNRGRKMSVGLAVYHEEDANDLSDLGIGTSSGKSSVSGDTHDDAHSVLSDRDSEIEKNHSDADNAVSENGNRNGNGNGNGNGHANAPGFGNGFRNNHSNHHHLQEYDSATTATASSPEPEEYTYEGAIRGYVSRVSQNIPRRSLVQMQDKPRETAASKGDGLNAELNDDEKKASQVVKVDILKRREIFEKASQQSSENKTNRLSGDLANSKSIKERLSNLEKQKSDNENIEKSSNKNLNRLSGDMSSIRERLSHLEKKTTEREIKNAQKLTIAANGELESVRPVRERLSTLEKKYNSGSSNSSDESRPSVELSPKTIKDRLSDLDASLNKETENRNAVKHGLCLRENGNRIETSTPSERSSSPDSEYRVPRAPFHRSLDSLDADASSGPDTFERVQSLEELDYTRRYPASSSSAELLNDTDREDSGIHTADVSCSVSQADENVDEDVNAAPRQEIIIEERPELEPEPETEPEPLPTDEGLTENIESESQDAEAAEAAEAAVDPEPESIFVRNFEAVTQKETAGNSGEPQSTNKSCPRPMVDITNTDALPQAPKSPRPVVYQSPKVPPRRTPPQVPPKPKPILVLQKLKFHSNSDSDTVADESTDNNSEETNETRSIAESEVGCKEDIASSYTHNRSDTTPVTPSSPTATSPSVNQSKLSMPISQPSAMRTASKIPTPLPRKTVNFKSTSNSGSPPNSPTSLDPSIAHCQSKLPTVKARQSFPPRNPSSPEEEENAVNAVKFDIDAPVLSEPPKSQIPVSVPSASQPSTPSPPVSPRQKSSGERRKTVVEVCEKVLVPQGAGLASPPATPFITVARVSGDNENYEESVVSLDNVQESYRPASPVEKSQLSTFEEKLIFDSESEIFTEPRQARIVDASKPSTPAHEEVSRPLTLTFARPPLTSEEMEILSPLSPMSKQILTLNLSSDEEIVTSLAFPMGPPTSVEPPKEKPPPPPSDLSDEESLPVEPLRRLNSTRRIKKELRTRRSDFLGIEGGNEDEIERELTLTRPPDMAAILAEERRVEQLHRRSYDTDSNYEQDSSHERDSGVELGHAEDWAKQAVSPDMSQHSRQSSEPFGASVTSSEEDEITKKEREIIEVLEKEEQWRYGNSGETNSDIGEKLAYKLRELEEEKMQLERERAQEVDLRRQEETMRKNDENIRKQEEMLRKREAEMARQEEAAFAEAERRNAETQRAEEQIRAQAELEEKERFSAEMRRQDSEVRLRAIENQIREQENKALGSGLNDSSSHDDDYASGEVLRVERELLQLEQEELKRQRSNLAYREQKQQKLAEQLQEQWKSMQDVVQAPVKTVSQFKALPPVNYRSSMPNLQESQRRKLPPPPIPPAKPLRVVEQRQRDVTIRSSRMPSADSIPQQVDASLRHSASATALSNHAGQQMTRQTLQALSAAPRPRIVQGDQWVQRRKSDVPRGAQDINYQHWLIQEAEQRRINEHNQRSPRKVQSHVTGTSVPYNVASPPRLEGKPLPDSIIQTLTQRVQNRAHEKPLPPRRRLEHSSSHEHLSVQHQLQQPIQPQQQQQQQQHKVQQQITATNTSTAESQEKMLSVSGKKKCSHCGDELGRGAAMIIESLRLFYHMECFKCCVCHVRLGDGRMGTDVRVRNHKLHCHNCYSSDDGVKFSCV